MANANKFDNSLNSEHAPSARLRDSCIRIVPSMLNTTCFIITTIQKMKRLMKQSIPSLSTSKPCNIYRHNRPDSY